MNKFIVASVACILALAGCAKLPDAIAPVSMTGAYDNVSCSKAQAMLTQEQTNLAALSVQQKNAATGDAVGVFLVLIPVSTMTGSNKEGEIAASKGKVNALTARLQSCR